MLRIRSESLGNKRVARREKSRGPSDGLRGAPSRAAFRQKISYIILTRLPRGRVRKYVQPAYRASSAIAITKVPTMKKIGPCPAIPTDAKKDSCSSPSKPRTRGSQAYVSVFQPSRAWAD